MNERMREMPTCECVGGWEGREGGRGGPQVGGVGGWDGVGGWAGARACMCATMRACMHAIVSRPLGFALV